MCLILCKWRLFLLQGQVWECETESRTLWIIVSGYTKTYVLVIGSEILNLPLRTWSTFWEILLSKTFKMLIKLSFEVLIKIPFHFCLFCGLFDVKLFKQSWFWLVEPLRVQRDRCFVPINLWSKWKQLWQRFIVTKDEKRPKSALFPLVSLRSFII